MFPLNRSGLPDLEKLQTNEIMSDESDFEEISFGEVQSECESTEEGKNQGEIHSSQKNNNYSTASVQVEIPRALLKRAPELSNSKPRSEVSSLASSYVIPVMAGLAIGSNDNDDDSWTGVASTTSTSSGVHDWTKSEATSAAASVACSVASSMRSDFQRLDIHGNTQRKCRKCTLLNAMENKHCAVCGTALVANPCPEVDRQLAESIKRKLDKEDRNILLYQEEACKIMKQMSLIDQAQVLTSNTFAFVSSKATVGISMSKELDFVYQAASFIEKVQQSNDPFVLAYVFTPKESFQSISKNGFSEPPRISHNIKAAARDFNGTRIPGLRPSLLSSISEEKTDEFSALDSNSLGWIVAITNYAQAPEERIRIASSGPAYITTLRDKDDALPLVCFDASLQDKDIIRQLLNGFCTVFHDFFQSVYVEYSETVRNTKRPKTEEYEDKDTAAACKHKTSSTTSGNSSSIEKFAETSVNDTFDSFWVATSKVDSSTEVLSEGSFWSQYQCTDDSGFGAVLAYRETAKSEASTDSISTNNTASPDSVLVHSVNNILFSDGRLVKDHDGNVRYKEILGSHAQEHGLLTDSLRRRKLVSSVISLLHNNGGMILQRSNMGNWKEMPMLALRRQVAKDLWSIYYQTRP